MPGTPADRAWHGFGLRLERLEVRPEDLHGQRALEPGLRLVDRVLGRLRVVEDDAGERLAASRWIASISCALVRIGAAATRRRTA